MYHVYSSFTILCDRNRQKSAPTFSSASQAGYPRRHVETLFWIFGDFIPFINQDVGSFFLYFCFCALYIWFSEIPATCRLLFCISCFRLWAFLLRREISVAVGGLKNWGGVACGNREVLLTWMGTVPGIHGLVKLVLIL